MAEDTSPMLTPMLTEARVKEIVREELVEDASPMLTETRVKEIVREFMAERRHPIILSRKRK